jgi:Ca2+-binding RTX toxin-like protein
MNGNAADNILYGLDGNDNLIGAGGADSLLGGLGNDNYTVDNAGDLTIEGIGEGTDTVSSPINWTLGNNLENLTLSGIANISGTGNALNNSLIGNTAANFLSGLGGNDYLDGGTGVDTLAGGLGNDTYRVANPSVAINENPGEGTDLVNAFTNYTLPAEVERLTLLGTLPLNGTGNGLGNLMNGNAAGNALNGLDGIDSMYGGSGNDVLDGGTGNDILVGGLGNDSLTGGSGADAFWFDSLLGTANVDTVLDFSSGIDKLQFSKTTAGLAAIGGLGRFGASDARFEVNATGMATTAATRLVYNTSSGALAYDSDGSNVTNSPVDLAVLAGQPALTANDIWIV